jgi:hypothetical protein
MITFCIPYLLFAFFIHKHYNLYTSYLTDMINKRQLSLKEKNEQELEQLKEINESLIL